MIWLLGLKDYLCYWFKLFSKYVARCLGRIAYIFWKNIMQYKRYFATYNLGIMLPDSNFVLVTGSYYNL